MSRRRVGWWTGRRVGQLALLMWVAGSAGCRLGPIVEGDVVIDGSSDLADFRDVEEINGDVYIQGVRSADLTGLDKLEWIGGNLTIGGERGNETLTSLNGLGTLQRLEGFLYVKNNRLLTDLGGLASLGYVGDNVTLEQNDGLTTIGPIPLAEIGTWLHLVRNYALVNVDGLESLTHVGFSLSIDANSALTHLSGLRNVRSAARLYITNNLALPTCAAQGFYEQLQIYGSPTDGLVTIQGNDDDGSCDGGPLGG